MKYLRAAVVALALLAFAAPAHATTNTVAGTHYQKAVTTGSCLLQAVGGPGTHTGTYLHVSCAVGFHATMTYAIQSAAGTRVICTCVGGFTLTFTGTTAKVTMAEGTILYLSTTV